MHYTFRDPFTVKVSHLINEDMVLQEDGSSWTNSKAGSFLSNWSTSACCDIGGWFVLLDKIQLNHMF